MEYRFVRTRAQAVTGTHVQTEISFFSIQMHTKIDKISGWHNALFVTQRIFPVLSFRVGAQDSESGDGGGKGRKEGGGGRGWGLRGPEEQGTASGPPTCVHAASNHRLSW